MDGILVVVLGITTAINLIIIKWKLEKKRYPDASLDAVLLFLLAWVFGGTITGLAVATISSMIISFYLMISPPDKLLEQFNKKPKKKGKKQIMF